MPDLWFKRRRYGWGYVPVTREGWLVVLGFVALVLGGATAMMFIDPEGSFWGVAGYLVGIAAGAGVLLWLTQKKGPRGHWRWGKKPEDDPAEDY